MSGIFLKPKSHAIKRRAIDPDTQPYLSGLFLLDTWREHPLEEFRSYLAEQGRRASTITVYTSMFSVFLDYLAAQKRTIDQCSPHDVAQFLTGTSLERSRSQKPTRQRRQYLLLLRRIFTHLKTLGRPADTNPAVEAAASKAIKEKRGEDNATRFLTLEERNNVINCLATRLDEMRKDQTSIEDQWLEYRDLALIAATMGGGMKVSHLERLTLNCMDLENRLIVLSEHQHTHRARLLDWALPSINHWLVVQKELPFNAVPLPSEHPVFQSDRSGGGRRRAPTARPFMHATSVHRRINHFLTKIAGITGDRACAQTLRNTYGALLIDSGASDNELIDFMGLRLPISAQRFRATYRKHQGALGANQLF